MRLSLWRNKEGGVRLLWKFTGVLLLAGFLVLAGSLIAGAIASLWLDVAVARALIARVAPLVSQLGVIVAVALFARYDRLSAADMGLRWNREGRRQLLVGLLLGSLSVTLIAAIHLITGAAAIISLAWQVVPPPAVIKGFTAGLAFFLLVSLAEELLGRAYLINNHSGSYVHAVVVSSCLFAALHLGNPGIDLVALINIALIGALFAYMYIWTGSLLMPIGYHWAWNFALNNIFSYPVSGLQRSASLLVLAVDGPRLLTGGDFGPEASLLASPVIILGFWSLRRYLSARAVPCPWGGRLALKASPPRRRR